MHLADNSGFPVTRQVENSCEMALLFLTGEKAFRQRVFGTLRIEQFTGLKQWASVDQHYMPGYFPRKIRTKSIES